jgi:prepilin-type N-terminal cleavage/methylation domain-containing protein
MSTSRQLAKPIRRAMALTAVGMTLVELMIVVVIIGVLASIAGVGYGMYVRRSRAQEARTMLASIASREDAYRAEFARFCAAGRTSGTPPTSLGVGSAWPVSSPGPIATDFLTGMPVEWAQLGFRPTGLVRYRYVVITGTPATAPPGEPGFGSSPNQDIWYIAEAYGDLDRDGTLSTFRLFSGNGNRMTITAEHE